MQPNKIAIHQPNFIPWPGYFSKIKAADIFVLLDTAEYSKNSFINRNKILLNARKFWFTIPVLHKGNSQSSIKDIQISRSSYRPGKMIKTLEQEYKDYPYFNLIMPNLTYYLKCAKEDQSLCELNEHLIRWICDLLDIKSKIIKASSLPLFVGTPTEKILGICNQSNANVYLSGTSGKNYLEEELFEAANIRLEYQSLSPSQKKWERLSILHWLFIEGPNLSSAL